MLVHPSASMFFSKSWFKLCATALMLVGCGTSIEFIPLNSPPHAAQPRPGSAVEVFTSSRPGRPFAEVGLIESRQESGLSQDDASAIVTKMREEAGRRGCDGMIVLGPNDETVVSGSTSRGSGSVSSTTLKGYRATCIMYRDAS